MFKLRQTCDHVHIIERNTISGRYTVAIRSGITLIARMSFDSGREAHRAFNLSAETFINRYN